MQVNIRMYSKPIQLLICAYYIKQKNKAIFREG